MIDTTRTVGTAETFDPKKVASLFSEGAIRSIPSLEKAIFCLEYIGQLQEEGLDLIFKGGSAVQILLSERWTRLSIDVDICTGSSEKELKKVLEKIHHKFNKDAFSYSPRDREIDSDIPFYFYKIKTPAITEKNRTILLDVMGIKPKLSTRQIPLKTFFFDSEAKVTTPTVGALLGDKLSTIGSTTIGRYLKDSRNGLEYAKHFYDINRLQESNFNMKECAQSFYEAIDIQSKVRNKDFTPDECFKDMLFTCQVASLSQQVGEQAIKELQNAKARERATSEFRILRDGLRRFRPLLVQELSYTWDDLRSYAARTALFIKMINNNTAQEKAKAILNADIPNNKEEILGLIERVKSLPKEKRWFIEPDEIVIFPKILKIWHDYFFLNELISESE